MSWEERIAIYKVPNFCQISSVSAWCYLGQRGEILRRDVSVRSQSTRHHGAHSLLEHCHILLLHMPGPVGWFLSSLEVLLWSLWVGLAAWFSLFWCLIILQAADSQVLSAKFGIQLARLCTGDFTLGWTLHCTDSPLWAVIWPCRYNTTTTRDLPLLQYLLWNIII